MYVFLSEGRQFFHFFHILYTSARRTVKAADRHTTVKCAKRIHFAVVEKEEYVCYNSHGIFSCLPEA